MRICIYTKRLTRRLDEGITRVAWELIGGLSRTDDVLALFSAGDAAEKDNIRRVRTNRLGLDPGLARRIRAFDPEAILYIPRGPAGPASLVLSRVLKWHARAPVVVMAPQTGGAATALSRKLGALLRPDLVLATSSRDQQEMARRGCAARFVPLGVDTARFTPAAPGRKGELRRIHGLNESDFVVLHVGHIKEGRNIGTLESLQVSGTQVLIAGSTFFASEAGLARRLEARGVRFLTRYFEHIEEIYQMADLYLFPTIQESACIGQPLSVLEAMACNIPVVSTRFGGLPDLFPEEGGGLFYADTPDEMAARTEYVRANRLNLAPATRSRVERYTWEASSQKIRLCLADPGGTAVAAIRPERSPG